MFMDMLDPAGMQLHSNLSWGHPSVRSTVKRPAAFNIYTAVFHTLIFTEKKYCLLQAGCQYSHHVPPLFGFPSAYIVILK